MAVTRIRNEEMIGLGAAVLLHVAVIAVLLAQPKPEVVVPPPVPVTVSLAEDIGLVATAPDPVPESRAATAPTFSSIPLPPAVEADIMPLPRTDPVRPTTTREEPRAQPTSRPTSRPTARPTTRATSRPTTRASSRTSGKPASATRSNATARSSGSTRGGASRVGNDFLAGSGSSSTSSETRSVGSTIGPSELASLDSAVGRQVKAKWQGRVPQGPDAEKLVTRVRFRLNPDGSLAGEPVVVGNTAGVTDLNRNQVGRHQEEAIRAVKLAARFDLPFEVPASSSTFTLKFDRN